MLDRRGATYRYRDYTKEPFTKTELKRILKQLGLAPRDILRKNDAVNRTLGLDGSESATVLIDAMVEHPTLVQRPIAVLGDRAVVGRPIENLLALL